MQTAKLVTLIFTETTEGEGNEGSPVRHVQRLWTTDGRPVAVFDSLFGEACHVFEAVSGLGRESE
jgi:hypothetical protein